MIVWWALPMVGALALLVGVGAGFLITRDRGLRTPPAAPAAEPPPPGMAALVDSVIDARDLAEPAGVLAHRLGLALAQAGVREYAPVGETFDPRLHFAIGTHAPPDPSSVDLIAEVHRVGYLRDRDVLRPPEVVVYRPGSRA